MESGLPEEVIRGQGDLSGLVNVVDKVDDMTQDEWENIEFIGPDWMDEKLHTDLAVLNDKNKGWRKVIEKLRSLGAESESSG